MRISVVPLAMISTAPRKPAAEAMQEYRRARHRSRKLTNAVVAIMGLGGFLLAVGLWFHAASRGTLIVSPYLIGIAVGGFAVFLGGSCRYFSHLAASGKGRDDPPPDDAAKTKLRRQALDWLKAELAAWTTLLATADEKQRGFIAQTLEHWQQDSDLAGIRDADALAKLPDDEREALAELWTGVAAPRERAQAPRAETAEP